VLSFLWPPLPGGKNSIVIPNGQRPAASSRPGDAVRLPRSPPARWAPTGVGASRSAPATAVDPPGL